MKRLAQHNEQEVVQHVEPVEAPARAESQLAQATSPYHTIDVHVVTAMNPARISTCFYRLAQVQSSSSLC